MSDRKLKAEILRDVQILYGNRVGATGATGPAGPEGPEGPVGEGVAPAGTTGQLLAKSSATDYDTEWVTPPTLDAVPAPVAAVDFNAQQATSFLIENRTDDTGCTQVGRIWLRTDL